MVSHAAGRVAGPNVRQPGLFAAGGGQVVGSSRLQGRCAGRTNSSSMRVASRLYSCWATTGRATPAMATPNPFFLDVSNFPGSSEQNIFGAEAKAGD